MNLHIIKRKTTVIDREKKNCTSTNQCLLALLYSLIPISLAKYRMIFLEAVIGIASTKNTLPSRCL